MFFKCVPKQRTQHVHVRPRLRLVESHHRRKSCLNNKIQDSRIKIEVINADVPAVMRGYHISIMLCYVNVR